jgi:hypothetical protein
VNALSGNNCGPLVSDKTPFTDAEGDGGVFGNISAWPVEPVIGDEKLLSAGFPVKRPEAS